jgi:hypothetical protein
VTILYLNFPLALLVVHFIGDFLLQNDWMAVNKSKRFDALALHVTIYSACFVLYGFTFVALTWVTHFLTDAITSRATSALFFFAPSGLPGPHNQALWTYLPGRRHWFFVVIGLDQLIHVFTLALTYAYVTGRL